MSTPSIDEDAFPVGEEVGPQHRVRDLFPAGAGAVLAVGVFALATQIPEGARLTQFSPRWWPELLSVLLLALSIGLAVQTLRRPSAPVEDGVPESATRQGSQRLALMLAAIVGYGVLWYFVDFRVSTAILFVALTWLGGGRGWKALILFPVLATAVLYVLFGVLLRVPL